MMMDCEKREFEGVLAREHWKECLRWPAFTVVWFDWSWFGRLTLWLNFGRSQQIISYHDTSHLTCRLWQDSIR